MNATTNLSQRRAITALLTGIVAAILILFRWVHPEPPVPPTYANGTYRNEKCGAISFSSGTVASIFIRVPYTLRRQKNGVAALTQHLLAVENDSAGCRVVYDQSSDGAYLTFGSDDPPRSVELWGLDEKTRYVFERVRDNGTSQNTGFVNNPTDRIVFLRDVRDGQSRHRNRTDC